MDEFASHIRIHIRFSFAVCLMGEIPTVCSRCAPSTSLLKLLCICSPLPSINQCTLSQMSTLVREREAGRGDKNTEKVHWFRWYKVVCDIIQCVCGQRCKPLKGHSNSFTSMAVRLWGILYVPRVSQIISRLSLHCRAPLTYISQT